MAALAEKRPTKPTQRVLFSKSYVRTNKRSTPLQKSNELEQFKESILIRDIQAETKFYM